MTRKVELVIDIPDQKEGLGVFFESMVSEAFLTKEYPYPDLPIPAVGTIILDGNARITMECEVIPAQMVFGSDGDFFSVNLRVKYLNSEDEPSKIKDNLTDAGWTFSSSP